MALPSMIDAANNAFGSAVIDPARSGRNNPTAVEAEIREIAQALFDGGCTPTATEVQGWVAGRYHSSAHVVEGVFDGGVLDAGRLNGPRFSADLGVGGPTLGSPFSAIKSYRLVGSRSDDPQGFVVGRAYRSAGATGVFVGLTGTCTGTTPAAALTPWFPGDLTGW
ncbi:MAG: hypothetical protein H6736_19560 [Alphaproteobacteria bacterium]|nr:hypothetical protein [Alphaproteobacteria bacterium]